MQASTGSARKTVAAVIIANVFPILAKFVSLLLGFSVFFMGFFEFRSTESSKVDYWIAETLHYKIGDRTLILDIAGNFACLFVLLLFTKNS
ncbi:hypothetical protein [Okeania sp. SIO2B3]|uniref:hypothetical protein n=1 Tax=Okeania sp. SIO2B3 TaxID=2607784 RepID=UPI0013C24740|nr:hypothetical protein [Okeania sp. SIO2B3]NET46586.1 hypothetical protein [Okeania sp. SIO2B3]